MYTNKKSLLFLLILLLLPITTKAYCTDEEKLYFKEIEDEYKVTYELNKETKNYTIKFYNAEPDRYTLGIYGVVDDNVKYKSISDNEEEYANIKPGEYKLGVFGVTKECDEAVKTFKLNLQKYNNFSEDPLCEGIEEFVLCQPTYDKEIDYETFVSRVNTYKKTQEKKQATIDKKDNNQMVEFIENNLFQIIIIGVFITAVIVTIILTAKSVKKSRRLE